MRLCRSEDQQTTLTRRGHSQRSPRSQQEASCTRTCQDCQVFVRSTCARDPASRLRKNGVGELLHPEQAVG